MQIGVFRYGLINGTIDRKQSPNVDKLLSEESLQFLYDLGRNDGKEGEFIFTWEAEKAITKTRITKVKDPFGRQDYLNHTVIVKFDNILQDILKYTNLLDTIQKGYIEIS